MGELKLCPKCNKMARVRKQNVKINGKLYRYLIFIHDDGSYHRTRELDGTQKISTVDLIEEILEENINEPMKFSEIRKLIGQRGNIKIHNQTISRALKNLTKRNILKREVKGNSVVYMKNEVQSVKIICEFMEIVLDKLNLKSFILIRNDSRFITNKVGIIIPLSSNVLKRATFVDSLGVISEEKVKILYSTASETLYEISINRFLRFNEYEILTYNIELSEQFNNISLRMPYEVSKLQILIFDREKVNLRSYEKDLLHFSPPVYLKKGIDYDHGNYITASFTNLKENSTISIEIE